jgi:hypothetical protein
MPLQTFSALDVLEAELANVYDRLLGQLLWVRGEVPRLHPITSQFHHVYVLHPGDDIIRTMASAAPGWLLLETAGGWGEERGGATFS